MVICTCSYSYYIYYVSCCHTYPLPRRSGHTQSILSSRWARWYSTETPRTTLPRWSRCRLNPPTCPQASRPPLTKCYRCVCVCVCMCFGGKGYSEKWRGIYRSHIRNITVCTYATLPFAHDIYHSHMCKNL